MRRDLPVLLDGDHYIPMKTPRRLEKATLSLQLSFVCSSFRPLPIPPLFDQTLLLRALLIAPPASARPTSRAALFCRPCHLPNPGHSVQLTFTRLLAFPAGCADGSGFCSQVRLRLFLHKYGLKPVRQFGLAQLRTAPLLHQRCRPRHPTTSVALPSRLTRPSQLFDPVLWAHSISEPGESFITPAGLLYTRSDSQDHASSLYAPVTTHFVNPPHNPHDHEHHVACHTTLVACHL